MIFSFKRVEMYWRFCQIMENPIGNTNTFLGNRFPREDKMSIPEAQLISHLLHFYASKEEIHIHTVLVSPNNTFFFRFLDTNFVPGAHRAWERATQRYNGAPSDSVPECTEGIDSLLPLLHKRKKGEGDMFLHDALHLSEGLLCLARWGLLNPGMVSFFKSTFPKSEQRLRLLDSASAFVSDAETEEERFFLKKELGNPIGIATLWKTNTRNDYHLLQSSEFFYLVHAHKTIRFPKKTHDPINGVTKAFFLQTLESANYLPWKLP